MSHTKGPWKQHVTPRLDKPKDKFIDIRAANGLTIASVWEYTHDSRAEQMDDARLIACAPDLLEACQSALEEFLYIKRKYEDIDNIDGPSEAVMFALDAAIGRARGEA